VTGSNRQLGSRHGMQATLTFTVVGFASGMGALAFVPSTAFFAGEILAPFLDGAWFLFGLIVAWGICNYIGIVGAHASPARYLLAGLMILVAPFFAGFWIVMFWYLSTPALQSLLPESRALTVRIGCLVGMIVGSMCVAVCVLVAVSSVGGKWDRRALTVLAASALATAMIPSLAVFALPGHDPGQLWPGLLHLVGETLFAGAGGYTLSRTWAGAAERSG